MQPDLLAQHRRSGTPPAPLPDKDTRPEETYRAFSATGSPPKPLRLELRSKSGFAMARAYTAITEISYDRNSFDRFHLLFPSRRVTVEGSGLQPVVQALLAGTCEWIAEIGDGDLAPPGAPVITQITLKPVGAAAPTPPKEES